MPDRKSDLGARLMEQEAVNPQQLTMFRESIAQSFQAYGLVHHQTSFEAQRRMDT